jgi:hypothetical protein
LWSVEECSKFVDQRKKDKLQWLEDQRHTNADNGKMCDVKIANTAEKNKREYLKRNINELQINSKKQLY